MPFTHQRLPHRMARLLPLVGVIVFLFLSSLRTAPGSARAAATSPAISAEIAAANQTLAVLTATATPFRDLRLLTSRLHGGEFIPIKSSAPTPHLVPGQIVHFWVANATNGYFQMPTVLEFDTQHAHWFVQQGQQVDLPALHRSAYIFEQDIYPTTTRSFGAPPSAGFNGDPRISILLGIVPGVGGYFSGEDSYSTLVNAYSNQQDILYINTDGAQPGLPQFNSTVAHELQHMLQFAHHPHQDTWINEGSSMLSQKLNGFTADGLDIAFTQIPSIQLDSWSEDGNANSAHYGASFLWMLYFYEHYGGARALHTLIGDTTDTGMALFTKALHQLGAKDTADTMFAKWVIANAVDSTSLPGGWYAYPDWTTSVASTVLTTSAATGNLAPYSTDYYTVSPPASGHLTLTFNGAPTVPLVPNQPFHATTEWWSNSGDMMDTTLTHTFDLRHVRHATLNYAVWFNTERNFDYGYVEISTDSGVTWHLLNGQATTQSNPNGANLGTGYTGASTTIPGNSSGWMREHIDLSPYTGQRVEVQFEYVTDDAYNLDGLTLDAISIPEIGFTDSSATSAGWSTQGWVRVANLVPVRWLVQAVITRAGRQTLLSLPINAAGTGALALPTQGATKIILAISPLAAQTRQPSLYHLHLSS